MNQELNSRIRLFYQQNKSDLLKQYPGLQIEFLESVFYEFWQMNKYSKTIGEVTRNFIEMLDEGIPLQYIIRKTFFYKSEFYVDHQVLIPRFESELLVEKAVEICLKLADSTNKLRVADIGTGSGALILSLLQELDYPVTAYGIDVSKKALNVARRNAYLKRFYLHPESKLEFIESDLFNTFAEQVDLIISNPPYIKSSYKDVSVHPQVTKFEPHVALFINDEDYKSWYQRFFHGLDRVLAHNGVFIIEGHESCLGEFDDWFSLRAKFDTLILKDYTNRDRFLYGSRRKN